MRLPARGPLYTTWLGPGRGGGIGGRGGPGAGAGAGAAAAAVVARAVERPASTPANPRASTLMKRRRSGWGGIKTHASPAPSACIARSAASSAATGPPPPDLFLVGVGPRGEMDMNVG